MLARSTAKTTATVAIVTTEHLNLGARMRMLVLCDHERASATLPVDLRGVIDREAGSAHAVLAALLHDDATAALRPLLVTGRTVAGAPDTLTALRESASGPTPALVVAPLDPPVEGIATLVGPWSSRDWVPVVDQVLRGRPQPGAGRHPGPARRGLGRPSDHRAWSTSPR